MASRFFMRHPEKENLNQYWFSENTIAALVSELILLHSQGFTAIACISTPSLYFSLPEDVRASSKVFDIDQSFARDPGFIYFDFNNIDSLPDSLTCTFDVVVIDPPFITREVWEKYARAGKRLAKENARFIVSSISENAGMLDELLGVQACLFKPSIPHLVYQYNFYTNYEAITLGVKNPEIFED
jgi:EEF1A lysine methyltransferase 1